MKECKIVHINDGNPIVVENGGRFFVEEYPGAEKYIESYLEEGYEVKQMIPTVMPNIQKEGSYSFFVSGFTFYLEREV